MLKNLITIFHPDRFQGWGKKKKYFEGWYYKIVNASQDRAFAFIPGIAYDEHGEGHSFIQFLDGIKASTVYHRFDINDFSASHSSMAIKIGRNSFSKEGLMLNTPEYKGNLSFFNMREWPSSIVSPGIMGPYTFVPYMQCNHGIVSMTHDLEGELEINGERIDFHAGTGYIEKDWGSSFPEAYVWMQTNHFEVKDTSLKISVAKIPWMGSYFIGFIGGLFLNHKMYQFTTYNGSKLTQCKILDDKVIIQLKNNNHLLNIEAKKSAATPLASPIKGHMEGKIEESMTSEIQVEMVDAKSGQTIFRGKGSSAALEVAGKTELLTTG